MYVLELDSFFCNHNILLTLAYKYGMLEASIKCSLNFISLI
jgi:hypothetical protein